MRLAQPRIAPVPEPERTEEQVALLKPLSRDTGAPNIFATLARYPAAMKAFLAWGNHVLRGGNSLRPREAEILMLRTGWLCRSGYEWTAHARIGKRAGLTDEEIERIKQGSSAAGWSGADRALLAAAEELHGDQFITDATWAALRSTLSEHQCMDVVFTVAQYTQVSMLLNSFGVQLDGGARLDERVRKAWGV